MALNPAHTDASLVLNPIVRMANAGSLADLAKLAFDALQAIASCDLVGIGTVDGGRLHLHLHAKNPVDPAAISLDLSSNDIAVQGIRSGRIVQFCNASGFQTFQDAVAQETGRTSAGVIVVPIFTEWGAAGTVYIQTSTVSELDRREMQTLADFADHIGLCLERIRGREQKEKSLLQVVSAFSAMVQSKDQTTGEHCRRIAEMAVAIGSRLRLSQAELETLNYAALLHDVGKVAVPDSILRKPGPLTSDETRIMQTHPTVGRRIVEKVDALRATGPVIEQHHERYDGSGYPQGLAGEEIRIEARIISVVDAFDAMRSTRPYRRALPLRQAVREIRNGAGTQFDPVVAQVFLRYLGY